MIQIVYTGTRRQQHCYLLVIEGIATEEGLLCFKKKLTSIDRVGNIWECEETETGVKGWKFLKNYDNKEQIAAWSARTIAEREQAKFEKVIATKSEYGFENNINAVVDACKNLNHMQKELIALRVYNCIKMGIKL